MTLEPVEQGVPDDTEPSLARQAEFSSRVEANNQSGHPPYRGVAIRSRGEVLWILRTHDWSQDAVQAFASSQSESHEASEVDLREADLRGTNLSGVDLHDANLAGASFRRGNLAGANLRGANLCGTDLRYVSLRGTDLSDSELDTRTDLKRVALDSKTLLGDIKWNGVSVTRVDWNAVSRLGDELDVSAAKTRQQVISACRYAARAYRGLAVLLRQQGLVTHASRFRLREQQLERRASRAERKYGAWLFSQLLDLVAGYGERPGRILLSYLGVVLGFAAAFFLVTDVWQANGTPLTWYESLVLSLSSFHGRGFFPSMLSLGDPIAVVAAVEAVVGLFIELILIATFSRRFLGN